MDEKILRELRKIRFRVGICALIMALPFVLGGVALLLFALGFSMI